MLRSIHGHDPEKVKTPHPEAAHAGSTGLLLDRYPGARVVGDARCDEPGLQLPHPGLHQRNFVLYPLAEIAPSLWVPDRGRVCRLLEGVPGDGIRRLVTRKTGV